MKCQKIGGRRYLCLAKFTLSSEYKWGKVRLYVVRVRLGSLKIMWVRLFSTNITCRCPSPHLVWEPVVLEN